MANRGAAKRAPLELSGIAACRQIPRPTPLRPRAIATIIPPFSPALVGAPAPLRDRHQSPKGLSMSSLSRRRLGAFGIVMVLGIALTTAQRVESRLSSQGRELLAQARARGEAVVTLLVATNPGATAAVSAALVGLGGNVRYQDDQLGYIRVLIATARAETAAGLNGVQAVDLDEVIPVDDPRPEAVDDVAQVDPPGAATPTLNAYMPTRDIGAPQ